MNKRINKTIKKIVAMTMGLAIGLMSSIQTFALEPSVEKVLTKEEIVQEQTQSTIKSSEAKEVLNNYGFTTETIDLKDLPKDATVLKFNSREEMEAYFKDLDKDFENPQTMTESQTDTIIPQENSKLRSAAARKVSTVQRSTYKLYGGTKCNLIADIKVSTSGSSKRITGCSQRTNMSGYTLGMGWRQGSATHTISSNKKSVTVKGSGQLITYLITEATKIEIGRRNVNLSLKHSV